MFSPLVSDPRFDARCCSFACCWAVAAQRRASKRDRQMWILPSTPPVAATSALAMVKLNLCSASFDATPQALRILTSRASEPPSHRGRALALAPRLASSCHAEPGLSGCARGVASARPRSAPIESSDRPLVASGGAQYRVFRGVSRDRSIDLCLTTGQRSSNSRD